MEQQQRQGVLSDGNTQLKLSSASRLNAEDLSPKHRLRRARSLSPDKGDQVGLKVSPIRRSGSPIRRQQIHEIEQQHAQQLKRKYEDHENRPRTVKFKKDVQIFENNSLPSPKLITEGNNLKKQNVDFDSSNLKDQLDELTRDVDLIKYRQNLVLDKLDYIIRKLE